MTKAATRAYVIEFGASMIAYAVVLIVSITLVENNPHAVWRVPVAVAPVVPAFFALLAFVRALGRMDELQRRIHLDAIALAFGATAILTFTYGFLENVGFPAISWIWIVPDMAILYGLGAAYSSWRYR